MIIRTKSNQNYTVIGNEIMADPSLDWKDLGLLVYLISKPEDWSVSVSHLCRIRSAGKAAIYTGLRNLIQAGYAKRKPNPRGGWDWWIFDQKQDVGQSVSPVNPPNTDNQDSENRNTENRNTDYQTLINTDIQQSTEKAKSTKKEKGEKEKTAPPEKPGFILPEEISKKAWAEFEQSRKDMKKPLTDLARTKAANQLLGLTHEQQRACIDYTILGRYTGLYPDRVTQSKHAASHARGGGSREGSQPGGQKRVIPRIKPGSNGNRYAIDAEFSAVN